jgi:hypothetical protein
MASLCGAGSLDYFVDLPGSQFVSAVAYRFFADDPEHFRLRSGQADVVSNAEEHCFGCAPPGDDERAVFIFHAAQKTAEVGAGVQGGDYGGFGLGFTWHLSLQFDYLKCTVGKQVRRPASRAPAPPTKNMQVRHSQGRKPNWQYTNTGARRGLARWRLVDFVTDPKGRPEAYPTPGENQAWTPAPLVFMSFCGAQRHRDRPGGPRHRVAGMAREVQYSGFAEDWGGCHFVAEQSGIWTA